MTLSTSSYTGSMTVSASNLTTSTSLFLKTFTLPTLSLQNSTSNTLQSSFILTIPVQPYELSSNVIVVVKQGNVTVTVGVSRDLDIVRNNNLVNLIDFSIMVYEYGSVLGDSNYNPLADLTAAGQISILDVSLESVYYDAHVIS
jgi:hypothetical protein